LSSKCTTCTPGTKYLGSILGNTPTPKELVIDGLFLNQYDCEQLYTFPCCCLLQGPYDIAAVSKLLELGADVNSYDPTNNKCTPLHILAHQAPAAFWPTVEDYQQAVNGPTPPQVWHDTVVLASLHIVATCVVDVLH
jgi:hypothetical protein